MSKGFEQKMNSDISEMGNVRIFTLQNYFAFFFDALETIRFLLISTTQSVIIPSSS